MTLSADIPPRMLAELVRAELNLGWGRVEPKEICSALDISYLEDELGRTGAVAGALVHSTNGRLAVVVNKHIRNHGRRRFTAAHELGHICIPRHLDEKLWCSAGDIEAYQANYGVEHQANEFAAELLLPTRTLLERLRAKPPSVRLFRSIAKEFGTSLTATACRVVAKSPHDLCALVLSTSSTVMWNLVSPSVNRRLLTWKVGAPGPTTVARELFDDPVVVSDAARVVEPEAWFTRWPDYLIGVREESVLFPSLGWVLSYLEFMVDSSAIT